MKTKEQIIEVLKKHETMIDDSDYHEKAVFPADYGLVASELADSERKEIMEKYGITEGMVDDYMKQYPAEVRTAENWSTKAKDYADYFMQLKEVRTVEDAKKFICQKMDEQNEKKKGTWTWKDIIYHDPKVTISDLLKWLNEYASQFQQQEKNNERIKKALENLIFTSGKLWDEIKPIKDTEIRTVTHPIIEEAKIVLASLSLKSQPEIIAKSGRKYRSIPDDIDIDEWDGMTINERLRYKGLIQQPSDEDIGKWVKMRLAKNPLPDKIKVEISDLKALMISTAKAMRDGKIPSKK